MSDAVRVALLGRAGKARDQLHRALGEAGAAIVVEGDPNELDPAQVSSSSPTCYLVSLEPAVERALDRFDALFGAPGVEVMFDDAEVSGRLDGWDLNRWARHIATKLMGTDGLPPVPAGALYGYEDAAPADPESLFGYEDAPPREVPGATLDFAAAVAPDDGDDLADSVAVDGGATGGGFDLGGDLGLDLELGGLDLRADEATGTGEDLSDSIDFGSAGDDAGGPLDFDIAALGAQLDAQAASGARMPSYDPLAAGDVGLEIEAIEAVAVADPATASSAAPAAVASAGSAASVASVAPAKPSFDFSNLALAPVEDAAAAAEVVSAPAAAGAGAVVILAGLGGPHAVRQLLSSLPETLSVPVLLYQHLEVGKHERLVDQLAKISRLPVELARDGASPVAGRVSLLPAGLTAAAQGESLVFVPGPLAQLVAALPPDQSMVIVLSGTDPALVPMILELGEAGGTVLAQDPEVCFDAAAAEAMQRQGATVFPALGLARQIAERWSR
jgi:chemosensory pili system protein ChpB (putative protein-glutamate methylesterase)